MIKITCKKCQESFRISEENMVDKETIFCPNCNQPMNSEILNTLKSYVVSKLESNKCLEKAKELSQSASKDGWGDNTSTWDFTIEEKTIN